MTVQPQELLWSQILHTANLCWLRRKGLTAFALTAETDAKESTQTLAFGIPGADAASHAELLSEWMGVCKKVERMYILLQLLAEHQRDPLPAARAKLWLEEGGRLRDELFAPTDSGVFSSMEDAVEEAQRELPEDPR